MDTDTDFEVDLPAGMYKALAAVAAVQGRTVNEALTDALTEFMARRQDRADPPEDPAVSAG